MANKKAPVKVKIIKKVAAPRKKRTTKKASVAIVRRKRKKKEGQVQKAMKSTITPIVLMLSIATIFYILFFMPYNSTGHPIMAEFGNRISESISSISMPSMDMDSNGKPGNGYLAVGIIGIVSVSSLIYSIKKGR